MIQYSKRLKIDIFTPIWIFICGVVYNVIILYMNREMSTDLYLLECDMDIVWIVKIFFIGTCLVCAADGLLCLKTLNKFYKASMKRVDRMNGDDFSLYVSKLLKNNDYRCVRIEKNGYGDTLCVIAKRDGVSYTIQCKRYKIKVGERVIKSAIDEKKYRRSKKAIVITNNYFTDDAIAYAKKKGVILWNRDKLIELRDETIDNKSAVKKNISDNRLDKISADNNIDGLEAKINMAIKEDDDYSVDDITEDYVQNIIRESMQGE